MNSAKIFTIFIGIFVVIICLLTSIRYFHSYTEVYEIRNLILGIASFGITATWSWLILKGQLTFNFPTVISLILGLTLLFFVFNNFNLVKDSIQRWKEYGIMTLYNTPWLIPDLFKAIFLPLFSSMLLLVFFLNRDTVYIWFTLGLFSIFDWIIRTYDYIIGAPGTRGVGHWLDLSIETVVIIATVYYFYLYRKNLIQR